jgi:1,4-alpha-glucan branching enzyme
MAVKQRWMILLILLAFMGTGCALQYIKPRLSGPVKAESGMLFQYYAPSARQVSLAGDFNNWAFGQNEKALNMTQSEDGTWSITVKLSPGRYRYKYVVDESKWEKDPNGESANDPDNNSLVVVD